MNDDGIEWSRAAWRHHVPEADDAFARALGDVALPDLAHTSALREADKVALDIDGARSSHGELDTEAARLAGWLGTRLAPGERVLLCGPTCLDFARCYLGILRAGCAVVLANPSYTADELAHLVEDSGAALAFAASEQVEKLSGLDVWPLEVPVDAKASQGRSVGAEDVALLAYTSGTTGRPKGVPLTHRQLVTSIRAAMAAWRFDRGDVLVHALPLFHQHGLGGLNATLIAGATARILSRFDPPALLDAADGASVLFAVPTMYERLVDTARAGAVLGALRLCVCGSAPLSESLAHRVAETVGSLPLVRYGTTESGLDVSNPYDSPRADTVGIPLPGVLVRLVNDEIQLSGPQVFTGYWRNPDADADALTEDGWFRTGDLGEIEQESGHLVIYGRSKELIITGGMNVYPREVEIALERHPDIAEAAVAGLPHEHWGEQVTAWVVPVTGRTVDPTDVEEHAKRLLAPYKRPKQVYLLEALPRNHMGKIARTKLDTPTGHALRAAEARADLGAFAELWSDTRFQRGIPIAVKDNMDVAGQWTGNGTTAAGRGADSDSEVVRRLRENGYVPIGRTAIPELAWSMVTPGCHNPWGIERDAGGSSGGSAVAVASSIVPVALGTDTGGSVRAPAALCGVAGLRPTLGTVSTAGVSPLAPSMDTVGVIAASADQCRTVHEILRDDGAAAAAVSGSRVGWPAGLWIEKADPEVRRLLDAAARELRAAGAEIVDVELPLSRRFARSAGYTTMLVESADLWGDLHDDPDAHLGAEVTELLRAGSTVSKTDYEQARQRAHEVRAELDAALSDVSALLLPTVPVTAGYSRAGTVSVAGKEEPVEVAYYRLTALASVTGLPALTVPAGLARDGLPVGAQLIGAADHEATLCRLGTVIEGGAESMALARARSETSGALA